MQGIETTHGIDELEQVCGSVRVNVRVSGVGFVGMNRQTGLGAKVINAESKGGLEGEIGDASIQHAPQRRRADARQKRQAMMG